MEITKELVERLQIVYIDNATYIGILSDEGETVNVTHASKNDNVDESAIQWWFKEANLDELEEVKMKGAQAYRVKDLPAKLMRHCKECLGVMDEVKSKAMSSLENQLFDSHIAKR